MPKYGGDEEHRLAFGEHVHITRHCRTSIDGIRRNSLWENDIRMNKKDVANLSDRAWKLLGRYISNNHHMRVLNLSYLGLLDSKAALLFRELDRSSTINCLSLQENRIGKDGIRSMVPFLKYSQNLMTVRLFHNEYIGVDGFELLCEALCNRRVERRLFLRKCNINNISAMITYKLPQLTVLDLDQNGIQDISALEVYTHLQDLSLRGNDLGKNGCLVISQLLLNKSSSLIRIELDSCGMGDKEVEMLAGSLKYNTRLTHLSLAGGNKISEAGHRAFSKLLNDVLSIEATYTSSHTLQSLFLPRSQNAKIKEAKDHIESALIINRKQGYSAGAAGRAKVITTQLNSNTRMRLSDLQGIEFSYEGLFAEIEPVFFPDILAVVGEEHGREEVYRVLVATASDLAFALGKRARLEERMTGDPMKAAVLDGERTRLSVALLNQTDALCANRVQRDAKLLGFYSGGNNHQMVDEGRRNSCIRKRRRTTVSF